MKGPEYAAELVADWVEDRIRPKLAELETRLGLDADTIFRPNLIIGREKKIALEEWPAVLVIPQRTVTQRLQHVRETGGQAWAVTYLLQLMGWVRGSEHDQTALLRMRYALALRELLLEHTELAAGTDPDAVVDADSLAEDYSPLFDDPANGVVAGVAIDFRVTVQEVLADLEPAKGTVETTRVDTALIPPHPAL